MLIAGLIPHVMIFYVYLLRLNKTDMNKLKITKNIRTLKEKNDGIKSFLEKRYNTGEKKKVKTKEKSEGWQDKNQRIKIEDKTDTVKKFDQYGIKSIKGKFTSGKKDEKPSYKEKKKTNYLEDGDFDGVTNVSKIKIKSATDGKSKIYKATKASSLGKDWDKTISKDKYKQLKKARKK